MAKREGHEKGVGPYAGGDKDSKVRRGSSGLGYPKPVDISRVVDSNHAKNSGFAGPLKPSRED